MFTEIFVDYLQNCGKTAYQIAKETGISQGTMNEYKNGKKFPTMQGLVKIANALNCSVDYLLGRTKNPHSHEQANSLIGNISNVSNNSGIVGSVGSTINAASADEQITELVDIYKSLSPVARAKLLVYADGLKEDNKG